MKVKHLAGSDYIFACCALGNITNLNIGTFLMMMLSNDDDLTMFYWKVFC